jgi:hypothetical protein
LKFGLILLVELVSCLPFDMTIMFTEAGTIWDLGQWESHVWDLKPKPLRKTLCTTLVLLMVLECVKYLIIEPCTNEVLGPSQVHSTSKKLLYQLDHLVQICNQPGMEHTTRKHVGKFFCLSYLYVKASALGILTCMLMNVNTEVALICLTGDWLMGIDEWTVSGALIGSSVSHMQVEVVCFVLWSSHYHLDLFINIS